MSKRDKVIKYLGVLGIIIFLAAVVIAVYMMRHNMGQAPGIDFGSGQYYYTDIPGWQKYFLGNHYENHVPMAVLVGLFFLWGILMYRLLIFLDQKWKS